MLSLTVFGISAGLSYLEYCNASKKYAMIVTAKDISEGGLGFRYCTGFLSGTPLEFKETPMLSLVTTSYDVFQKINISNGCAYTTNTKQVKNRTFDSASVQLNGVDITNLVPKLHEKFAVDMGETYEASAPVDLINSNIRLGTFQVSLQNEALAGLLKTYHGVVADPQTSYTVVGFFNGKCFINNPNLIYKNVDIHTIRLQMRMKMNFWENTSFMCIMGGIVFGLFELVLVTRN